MTKPFDQEKHNETARASLVDWVSKALNLPQTPGSPVTVQQYFIVRGEVEFMSRLIISTSEPVLPYILNVKTSTEPTGASRGVKGS